MKSFVVNRRIELDIGVTISAENFAGAEAAMEKLKLERFVKVAPGADLNDWSFLLGTWITEDRE